MEILSYVVAAGKQPKHTGTVSTGSSHTNTYLELGLILELLAEPSLLVRLLPSEPLSPLLPLLVELVTLLE